MVEPILGLPVVKDLIVDMEPFMAHYRAVMPYFVNDDPVPEDGRERRQSPEDRAIFDDTTKCILCAACTAACPINRARPDYLGPAALLRAFRYIFDSRDSITKERLEKIDTDDGVWGCKTMWRCTEVCPKEIPITQCLGQIKRAVKQQEKDK